VSFREQEKGKAPATRHGKRLGRKEMRKVALCIVFSSLLVLPGRAQTDKQAAPKDPVATWLRRAYTNGQSEIVRSAEKVPEEFYGMRPGPQVEVRTFGQIVGHIANFNYLWCSQAKSEKNPGEGKDFTTLASKADLVSALKGAFAYCDEVYAALTDASGEQMVQVTREDGRQAQLARISLLILNWGHNTGHYENLVTYMRIKSIVPPSSEPRPQ
jgi:uncharacterized damage-inducible protein DinB